MSLPEQIFALVAEASWRGGGLILCVLLLRWLARGKLPTHCLSLLWLLVALKLLVPIAPPVSWSVFNVRHWQSAPSLVDDAPQWRVSLSATEPPAIAASVPSGPVPTLAQTTVLALSWRDWAKAVLPAVWLAGVALQTALLFAAAIRFRRQLARSRPLTEPHLVNLARECCTRLGLNRSIPLFEHASITAPAVAGVFRPRLLLPEGFADRVSQEELRFVLLHEFAHVQRGDLVMLWLFTFARMLHWFNPLAWIAARAARADAELACDERVLRLARPEAATDYGTALLRIAQLVCWRPGAFPTAGVIGSGRTLKARLQRIAAYHPPTWRSSALTAAIVFLAAVGFAGNEASPVAQPGNPPETVSPASTPAAEVPVSATPSPAAAADDLKLIALSFAQRGGVLIPHARLRRSDGTEFTLFGKGATREGITLSSVEWSEIGEARVFLSRGRDGKFPVELSAASPGKPPTGFAEGWKVVGISLPAPNEIGRPAITFETPAGVSVTLESDIGNESGLLASVEGIDDPAAPLRVQLSRADGKQRATLPVERSLVAHRGPDSNFAPRVEIEAKFFEFSPTVPMELALEGILGTGKPSADSSFGKLPNPFPLGVFSDPQFQSVVRALGKKKGVDLLSAPRVTAKSGQLAVIEIIRELRYPVEWEEDTKKPGFWLPTSFETRNAGVTLEVKPGVREEGTIDLELTPQVVEFAGFVDLESRQPLGGKMFPDAAARKAMSRSAWILEPGARYTELKPGRRTEAIFSERRNRTSVSIFPGQTVLLTHFPEARETKPFRRRGGDRRLIVMVTARLVSPEGQPVQARAEPASPGENVGTPVLNKPGFVTSPFSPDKGYIDVRGFPSGVEVKDPYSGKMFRLP
ncbi:MAG TPA: M56 family metallopeptidase [Chthoniobacteraceae bacterium]|jgi:beta-lactamase regulating signal transducer with metallopeptidase domain